MREYAEAKDVETSGWWIRSEIVWHKPNPMPESVTDRPTNAHEKMFLLSKSARYFYDAEAVREAVRSSAWPAVIPGTPRGGLGKQKGHGRRQDGFNVARLYVNSASDDELAGHRIQPSERLENRHSFSFPRRKPFCNFPA